MAKLLNHFVESSAIHLHPMQHLLPYSCIRPRTVELMLSPALRKGHHYEIFAVKLDISGLKRDFT